MSNVDGNAGAFPLVHREVVRGNGHSREYYEANDRKTVHPQTAFKITGKGGRLDLSRKTTSSFAAFGDDKAD
jgi:hypothetical protein